MSASQRIDLESVEAPVRRGCIVGGCTCKDSRIVSYRRAAFFAATARRSGETANRLLEAEAEWPIPLMSLDDLDFSSRDGSLREDNEAELVDAVVSVRSGLER
jgi:hypothetical protein